MEEGSPKKTSPNENYSANCQPFLRLDFFFPVIGSYNHIRPGGDFARRR